MARIPVPVILDLIELGINAFGKGRKVRKVAALLEDLPERAAAFKSAREKIDTAEAAGEGATLTADEIAALDLVMDQFSKAAKKVKKALNK